MARAASKAHATLPVVQGGSPPQQPAAVAGSPVAGAAGHGGGGGDAALRDRVQSVINLIRPAVQADGGDIELVDVRPDGLVQIRFHGACYGCPSSSLTLQDGILRNLREQVPEVTRVEPVP